MNVNEVGENFNCDCGFSWRRGQSGSHSCGDGLRKQIAELKAQRDALAAENAALARYFSASSGAVEHWNSWADAGDKLASAPETAATDAYLNSMRAEGAEAVQQKLARMCAVAHRSDKEVIHALSLKAGEIAAQLRAGEPS